MKKRRKSLARLDKKIEKLTKENAKKINTLRRTTSAQARKFNREARKTTATAIASAFSFVIALFWRDAVQELRTKILETAGLASSGYIAKLIAAVLVTYLGVLAILKVSEWGQIEKKFYGAS